MSKEFQVLVVNKFDKTLEIITPIKQNGNFQDRVSAEAFAKRAAESNLFDSVEVVRAENV